MVSGGQCGGSDGQFSTLRIKIFTLSRLKCIFDSASVMSLSCNNARIKSLVPLVFIRKQRSVRFSELKRLNNLSSTLLPECSII
jgi:hypothetical protein